jgi:hypothetical protein
MGVVFIYAEVRISTCRLWLLVLVFWILVLGSWSLNNLLTPQLTQLSYLLNITEIPSSIISMGVSTYSLGAAYLPEYLHYPFRPLS